MRSPNERKQANRSTGDARLYPSVLIAARSEQRALGEPEVAMPKSRKSASKVGSGLNALLADVDESQDAESFVIALNDCESAQEVRAMINEASAETINEVIARNLLPAKVLKAVIAMRDDVETKVTTLKPGQKRSKGKPVASRPMKLKAGGTYPADRFTRVVDRKTGETAPNASAWKKAVGDLETGLEPGDVIRVTGFRNKAGNPYDLLYGVGEGYYLDRTGTRYRSVDSLIPGKVAVWVTCAESAEALITGDDVSGMDD